MEELRLKSHFLLQEPAAQSPTASLLSPQCLWIATVLCAAFLLLFHAEVPNVQATGAYEAHKRSSPQLPASD